MLCCITATRYLKEPGDWELSRTVRRFETGFAGLLCFAHDVLKGAGVTESHVRIFLNQMSVGQKENIPLYEQRMAEIISHVTLEEIFLFCSRIEVWNFLNFQLLQDLADHFEVEQLKTRLQEHSTAVVAFKRSTKLVDFLRIWAGRNSLKTLPESEPIFAKLKAFKWKDYTLEDVARHEQYLASEFRLRQLVMRFSNAAEGCVVLMWLVTKSVAAEMKKIMSSDEKPCLDSLTIEELNIGGRTFKVTKYDKMERVTAMEKFFERNCIHGYHVYKEVWAATVGEALVCEREPQNASDRYAVAVKKELSQYIYLESCRGCVHYFIDGKVHSHKCERRARACGMAQLFVVEKFAVEKRLIIVALCDNENCSTTKISRFTVYAIFMYKIELYYRSHQAMTVSTNIASTNWKCSGLTELKSTFSGSSHFTVSWRAVYKVE